MIQEVSIDDIGVIKNQFWNLHKDINPQYKGLHIVCSKNGGGKTTLLNHIAKKYEKKAIIYKISTSIENFRAFEKVEDYMSLAKTDARPPQVRQYKIAYETILTLPSRIHEGIVEQCNDFLQIMKLDIRLDGYYLKTGRICFQHSQLDENERVDVMTLSSGEKTAFVLWLMYISHNKPDLLLLDEFDSSMDDDNINQLYYALAYLSRDIQIIIATHRNKYITFEKQHDFVFKRWSIENGYLKQLQPK